MSSNRCLGGCTKRGVLIPVLTLHDVDGNQVGTARMTELKYCTLHADHWSIMHSLSDVLWLRISADNQRESAKAKKLETDEVAVPIRNKTVVSWEPYKTKRQRKAAAT